MLCAILQRPRPASRLGPRHTFGVLTAYQQTAHSTSAYGTLYVGALEVSLPAG